MGASCRDYAAGAATWQTNDVAVTGENGRVALTFNLSCAMRSPNAYYNDGFPACCAECAATAHWCETTVPLNEAPASYWTEWNTSACASSSPIGAQPRGASTAGLIRACPVKWRRGTVTGGTYPAGGDEAANYRWCRDVAGVTTPVQTLPCDPAACDPGCRPVYTWWEPTRPPFNVSDPRAADLSLAVSDIVMLGWVTQRNGSLTFESGQSWAEWERQRRALQSLGFRVHAYAEFNPSGAVAMVNDSALAEPFYAQVANLLNGAYDGFQYSIEGCVQAEKELIPEYGRFVAGLKRAVGASKELSVWIHMTCETPVTDFCMTCANYSATDLDRVIYYGPQYMASLTEADIATIARAQAVLGAKGVPGMDPAALGGNLFFRPPANTSLLRGISGVAFQAWPVTAGPSSSHKSGACTTTCAEPNFDPPGPLLAYRQSFC